MAETETRSLKAPFKYGSKVIFSFLGMGSSAHFGSKSHGKNTLHLVESLGFVPSQLDYIQQRASPFSSSELLELKHEAETPALESRTLQHARTEIHNEL